MDRKSKIEYLTKAPNINNAGVKAHEKYQAYVTMVQNANKGEVKA